MNRGGGDLAFLKSSVFAGQQSGSQLALSPQQLLMMLQDDKLRCVDCEPRTAQNPPNPKELKE
eukprot:1066961-Amphidinium_carterae.1